MKRNTESGQALLLVVLGLSIFVIGAAGLALDGSHLYAQRQMAQAAADAAAQAGILSVYDGSSSVGGNSHGFGTTAFTCAASDPRTPCYYAQTMNGFNAATDTVSVSFPTAASAGVPSALSLLRVTVQRTVNTTLMSLLGTTVSTISASGTAAIVSITSPVPILVLHPSNAGALSSNGNPTVTICGGAARSIQVNSISTSATSMNSNTTINLSRAGPPDPGDCSTGTGADFGDFGGPGTPTFTFVTGSTSHYVQPASPIADPLANVPVPGIPAAAPGPTALANGVSGCPTSPSKACKLYSPGLYSSGIDVKGETGVFKPGIYYVTSGGFGASANGDMLMATGFTDGSSGTNTGWTGNMLVYNTGNGASDVFSVGSNGSANLVGSPAGSIYKGILFFEDRAAGAHVSPPAKNAHNIGGGGAVSLVGTIYVTNTTMTGTQYQELALQGTPGSATNIQGEIITSALTLGGNAAITMNLSSTSSYVVRQVALVQ